MAQNKEEKIRLFKEAVQTDCGDCSKCIFEDDPITCRLYYTMNFLYEKAKQEIAREIFEDIRNTCAYSVVEHDGVVLYHTKCYGIMATKLDELEKKYTENKNG